MDKTIIYKEKINSVDPRLKRSINHDSRSKLYTFNTARLVITSTVHPRHIPILDQGRVGSCTGNAGIGALATDPFYKSVSNNIIYPLNETGAVHLYSDAEVIDGSGPYPPNDNGSCGLSIAKALKNAGLISGYQHTFTLDDALKALTVTPIIVGMYWYEGMMHPDVDGRIHPTGNILGGHEVVARQIDAPHQRVWFDNSWGNSWGVQGRFYLTFDDLGSLLSQQGDVMVFVPNTEPSPRPSTTTTTTTKPNPDTILAAAMKAWIQTKGL